MHPTLIATASARGGVFTAADALAAGYTRDEIRARLASGRWQRMRRGVYRRGGPVDEHFADCAAAVAACTAGTAVVSHRSSAYVHELPLLERVARPEISFPLGAPTRTVRGCVVHHRTTPEGDRVMVRGLPVTTVARTLVDLALTLALDDAVVACDHALRTGAVGPDDLARAQRAATGSAGNGRAGRALAFASPRSGSVGESVARVMFAEQGLPAPLLTQLLDVGGRTVEVDFLWPEHNTVAEFDGRLKYGPDNDRGDDRLWLEKLREDDIRERGLEVVRITWHQVRRRAAETAARIRGAFARGAHR